MPKNLGGYVTLATPPFDKFLRGHAQTPDCPWEHACQICSFNCFKLVWLTSPLHTDTNTHRTKTVSCHSLRSLGGDNNVYLLHDARPVLPLLRLYKASESKSDSCKAVQITDLYFSSKVIINGCYRLNKTNAPSESHLKHLVIASAWQTRQRWQRV